MADVVLIQPLETADDAKGPTLASMENLGLAYLKAILKKDGISVVVINSEARGYDSSTTASLALSNSPAIVGISPVAMTMTSTLSICERIKRDSPNTVTVLGGHHATLCSNEILSAEESVDFIFRGDSENAFLQFTRAVLANDNMPVIHNLATRDKIASGTLIPIHRENALDALPWPDREESDEGAALTEARLVTSRGCYFRCAFCTTPSFYNRDAVISRDLEDVIREIQHLRSKGINQIWFNDDLFVANSVISHKRARSFCELLRKSGERISFRPMVRADSFNRDRSLIPELIQAGMSHVFVGVEAGNDADLKIYRKDIEVDENVTTVKEIKSYDNLVFQMGFIMFNPWSTVESLRANLAFLGKIGELYRAFPLFRCLSVFPNTSIAFELARADLLGDVTYKSEAPYAYKFINSSVGHAARFQHEHYPSISRHDSALYRNVSSLRKQGHARAADSLGHETAAVNKAFFEKLIALIETDCLTSETYEEIFELYLEQFKNAIDKYNRGV